MMNAARTIRGLVIGGIVTLTTIVMGFSQPAEADDCGPPPPTSDQSITMSGKAQVGGMLKKLLSGELDGTVSDVAQDTLSKYPNADKTLMAMTILHMYCNIISDTKLSADKRSEVLGKATQEIFKWTSQSAPGEPPKRAEIYNPSAAYMNPAESRTFACVMEDNACGRARVKPMSDPPTLTLQFGNQGPGAAADVNIIVFVRGTKKPFTRHIDRIASGVMTKSVFTITSPAVPRTAACIDYAEEGGSRAWVLLAGTATDYSGGGATAMLGMVSFDKVDDGKSSPGNAACEDRARAAVTG